MRERTGHPSSYAEAKNTKSLALHTYFNDERVLKATGDSD